MGWFSKRKKHDDDATRVADAPGQAAEEAVEEDDPRWEQWAEARNAYWNGIGTLDDQVVAHLVSPEFMGAPPWPTTRQSYVITRTDDTVILATDGMTDPFRDDSGPANGFGAEVYLESPALVGANFNTIAGSWELGALQNFAANVADLGGITGHLEQYGVVSMELPAPEGIPEHLVTPQGTVGILIGMDAPDRSAEVALAPGEEIRMIPITLITPAETAYIVSGGGAARGELVEKLAEAGVGVVSDVNRQSVL